MFIALGLLLTLSVKYVWLYVSLKPDPKPPVARLLLDLHTSQNPEILLAEANRLAWIFNSPRAGPLYVRAEELFKERGDVRNEIYARVGRIRAQAETMSWIDVSQMLGQQLNIPVVKNDPRLRLWCLAAKGYTDLEINSASAKLAWTEAKQIAHTLGENEWEARAEGELGIIAFLQGDSRRATVMVGDAFLSAKASGDVGGQVLMLGTEILSEGRRKIEDLAKKYLNAIRARQEDFDSARHLHYVLFGQLPPEANREFTIVVPDGILHLLPLDTLRNSAGALLLQSRTITYVPAATVLQVLRNEKAAAAAQHTFLGVGDVPYQNQGHVSAKLEKPIGFPQRIERGLSDVFGTALHDLPETREEVLTASKVVGRDSLLLLGPNATETAFKSAPLADFKIVHIAAHGFVDTQFPERSGLVLGVDPGSHDDGLLQVREIIRLHFNADLVTLSACITGVGKIEGEEGVTNLVEAFLVRGARSVVAVFGARTIHTPAH